MSQKSKMRPSKAPCVCGSNKMFKKCCGNPLNAQQFSQQWERREVERWQKWHADGQVTGEPPLPIMLYAERFGIILNTEHLFSKSRRDAQQQAESRRVSAFFANVAALSGASF